jgi:hypothetical protein
MKKTNQKATLKNLSFIAFVWLILGLISKLMFTIDEVRNVSHSIAVSNHKLAIIIGLSVGAIFLRMLLSSVFTAICHTCSRIKTNKTEE